MTTAKEIVSASLPYVSSFSQPPIVTMLTRSTPSGAGVLSNCGKAKIRVLRVTGVSCKGVRLVGCQYGGTLFRLTTHYVGGPEGYENDIQRM